MANSNVSCIVLLINLCLYIANMTLIILIAGEIKYPLNPLEQYEYAHNPIKRFLLYSSAFSVNKNDAQINNYCQCGEEFLSNICTEEQIIRGCYDITPNDQTKLFRNLASSICDEVNNELNNKKKFSEIFTLNYGTIRKITTGFLIIFSLLLGVIITFVSIFRCLINLGSLEDASCIVLIGTPIILIIIILAGIANFILFIIMIVKYYKGRTTGEFIEFYEDCSFPEKGAYLDVYNKLKKTHSYMTAFIVLNSIGIVLNYIGGFFFKRSFQESRE